MRQITVALVGQPNVGKTSLINSLSGAHLKVGNFTGVTVQKAQASLVYRDVLFTIIDLPGIYSLSEFTLEEKITSEFLAKENYDVILNIADATNLERNLPLTLQILRLQRKCVLVLNMMDEAEKERIKIDEKILSDCLGIDVISTSALQNTEKNRLLDAVLQAYENKNFEPKLFYNPELESEITTLEIFLSQRRFIEIQDYKKENNPLLNDRFLAILLLSHNSFLHSYLQLDEEIHHKIDTALTSLKKDKTSIQQMFLNDEVNFLDKVLQKSVSYGTPISSWTQKLDKFFLHKRYGLLIFIALMFFVFNLSFLVGGFFQDFLDNGSAELGDWVKQMIPSDEIGSLIGDGIIAGVGAVVSFLPLIIILYLGISLLEGTGYMARVAFLLDGLFHKFGLHGKSFIPLVTGFGCSVPAYMAARTLQNKNERLITLFVIGFMSCSARLPIYVLFIGTFFSDHVAGLVLFAIYMSGSIIALVLAKFLKLTIFRGRDEPFVMELPKYRMPSFRLIYFSIYSQALMYLKKAGTFILLGSMLIWFGAQYPKDKGIINQYDEQIQSLNISDPKHNDEVDRLEREKIDKLLQQSYLGRFGSFIQPVFQPMDFDWRLSISLIMGFAAKENLVSSLGVLYALGEGEDESSNSLRMAIKDSVSFPTAIAFIVFIMLYIPCFAATIAFGRESGGVKSVIGLLVFTSLVAYLFSALAYFIAYWIT